MPCFKPIKCFWSKDLNPSGKRSLTFSQENAVPGLVVSIPCGQCIDCRLERSRQWAIRCLHEASLYEDNCFVTLTFDDSFLASDGSLHKADFQKFMKRLRKRFGKGVRYFHCGEYGALLNRPHHHACLFNFDFPDKVLWSIRDNVRLYRSAILEELWPFGFCTVGDVTFESAAYVARYVTKKITGKMAEDHYKGRVPEYNTMSRRPGIASAWFDKYKDDVFPSDEIVIRGGVKCKPPKFYDSRYDLTNPVECATIKADRKSAAILNPDNTPARLRVRCKVRRARIKMLKRGLENGS